MYFSASHDGFNNSPAAIVCLTGILFTALFYAAEMIMCHWKYHEVWNRKEILVSGGYSSCSVIGWPWWVARCSSSCSLTLLLSRTWGKNKMKKLMGQDKDRKITQLLSWANRLDLGKTHLLPIKIVGWWEAKRKTKPTPCQAPFPQVQLRSQIFYPFLPVPSSAGGRGMGGSG